MNPEHDAAEQIVNSSTRIIVNGVEVLGGAAARGAVSLASFLMAYLKQQKKTKGKTGIGNFAGKPTKAFVIPRKDLEIFAREAKLYGVLYAAVIDKKNNDGLVDIIVNDVDAAKVNRIADRFALSMDDVRRIQDEILSAQDNKQEYDGALPSGTTEYQQEQTQQKDTAQDEYSLDDGMLDELFADVDETEHPTIARTEEKGATPSEHTSKSKETIGDMTEPKKDVTDGKKSVKKEIDNKRRERKQQQAVKPPQKQIEKGR